MTPMSSLANHIRAMANHNQDGIINVNCSQNLTSLIPPLRYLTTNQPDTDVNMVRKGRKQMLMTNGSDVKFGQLYPRWHKLLSAIFQGHIVKVCALQLCRFLYYHDLDTRKKAVWNWKNSLTNDFQGYGPYMKMNSCQNSKHQIISSMT